MVKESNSSEWLDEILGRAFWPSESPTSQELYSRIAFVEAKQAILTHLSNELIKARIDELDLFWAEETGKGDYPYILDRQKELKAQLNPTQIKEEQI